MTTKRELETICGSSLEQCTNAQLYRGLVKLIANHSKKESVSTSQKKVYYISAEFLTGRLLINNLHNLGLYNSVKTLLHQAGRSLEAVSCEEPEPSLGNGGLGRLAACFLDSIASLGLPGDGIGLCYHLGLFRQVFAQRCQTEQANPWRQGEGFLRKTGRSYPVAFKDRSVVSTEYELDVIGAGGQVNTLHLFDLDTVDPGLVTHGIDYDKTKVEENLTLFLYPDDRDEQGRYLRLYQQYFMVSNGAQLILEECEAKGCTLYDLPEYAVIQINDTHPALIIPELIRLLCHRGISLEKAADIVTRTCAYTNHTVLAEALETWPLSYLEKTVPALVDIVKALNQRVKKTAPENPDLWIIDAHEQVHMARLAVHYTFSTNGVAALHTHILKNSVLKPFYTLYPQRFNNKTNGISFRRWLTAANPLLDELIGSYIGDGFRKDPEKLEKLLAFREDEQLLKKLLAVKQENKKGLQGFLEKTQGVTVSPDRVFDVQIKRLHEYKRQQLNLLYYIHQYFQIKQGRLPKRPLVGIFGAKAAPAYTLAKDIIHAILCLQDLLKKDPAVSPYLQVVMVENYNVTAAEHIIPACDISEQISLASKEASGTGNMKMMVNGGVTLGTEDGANVEIHQLVGDENIYVFGMNSQQVLKRYEEGDYDPHIYYQKQPALQQAVDFLTHPAMTSLGQKEKLQRLQKELLTKDWFMTFPDFQDYCHTKDRMLSHYENSLEWAKKMLVNIAKSGYFSSDRTIREYNRDIWKLEKIQRSE